VSFDVAPLLMPAVTSVGVDLGVEQITWMADPGPSMGVLATATQVDGGEQPIATWSILLRGALQPRSVGIPPLPADLASVWSGLGQDTTLGTLSLVFAPVTYDVYRLHAFTDLDGDTLVQRSTYQARP